MTSFGCSRNDELEVISSIYCDIVSMTNVEDDVIVVTIAISKYCTLKLLLPQGYPVSQSPTYQLRYLYNRKKASIDEVKKSISAAVDCIIRDGFGQEVIYLVIEAVREKVNLIETDAMILEVDGSDACTTIGLAVDSAAADRNIATYTNKVGISDSDAGIRVYHGSVFSEKKSTFQSHFAHVYSFDDVVAFRDLVLDDRKIASATHNILAYRFTCQTTGVLYHDYDDDGETAAGGRLAEMIRLMDADNVAIIVTRNFGGILLGMLNLYSIMIVLIYSCILIHTHIRASIYTYIGYYTGPERFKFINNSARNLLEEHGIGVKKK